MRRAFNSEEDYFRWDSYIAQLFELDLSEKERVQITLVINYLRGILGENFLEEAFNEYHPFLSYYLLNSFLSMKQLQKQITVIINVIYIFIVFSKKSYFPKLRLKLDRFFH